MKAQTWTSYRLEPPRGLCGWLGTRRSMNEARRAVGASVGGLAVDPTLLGDGRACSPLPPPRNHRLTWF